MRRCHRKNVFAMSRWGFTLHLFGRLPGRPGPPRPSKSSIFGSGRPQKRHRIKHFFSMSFLGPGRPQKRHRKTFLLYLGGASPPPPFFGRLPSRPGPPGPSNTSIFGPGRPQKRRRENNFFSVVFGGPGGPKNDIEKNVFAMSRCGLAPHLFGELPNRPGPPRPSKSSMFWSGRPQKRHRKVNFFSMSFVGPGRLLAPAQDTSAELAPVGRGAAGLINPARFRT